jgi:4-amino-4-deoxy-L-arabinose transferase-like glycosyltransferase
VASQRRFFAYSHIRVFAILNGIMSTNPVAKPWWSERELLVLIFLVVAAYWIRIGDVSMRGEEPTRSEIAFCILDSGDWILPKMQGDILNRPPMQNWIIAISSAVFHSRQPWAVRFPSVLAMLFTTLLIYGYARTCQSRIGALASAAAFPTFAEMFTTGCQAETEMVFIAMVSAALLVWHWGVLKGWNATLTWVVAYAFIGMGVLCKGPQPPVYFLVAVTAYLVWAGHWRRLFSWAHLAGIAVAAGIVLAWMIPCACRTSFHQAWIMIFSDSTNRFHSWTPLAFGRHLVEFPLEILACTLPWSLLLAGYLSPGLRGSLGTALPQAFFTSIAAGFAFVSIWLPPEGQSRYLAPLYPCLAVLIGLVVECVAKAEMPVMVRGGWRQFAQFFAGVMGAAALAVIGAALLLPNHPKLNSWAAPPLVALGYAAAIALLVPCIWKSRLGGDATTIRGAVLAVAFFMVLAFTGIVTDARVRRCEDQASAIARLKRQIPPGHRLVSFGHIDLLFEYYFGEEIERVATPTAQNDPVAGEDVYFCFNSLNGSRPKLPFACEDVAVISMERNRTANPERTIVVCRRIMHGSRQVNASPRSP